jgi:succinoglycan biosynthesis transport protein ExoP
MEIRSLTRVLRKRLLLFVAFVALTIALAAAFAFTKSKVYDATATLVVLPTANAKQAAVLPDQVPTLVGTYAEVAKSQSMLNAAAKLLGHQPVGSVQTGTLGGTGTLTITAEASNPRDAQATAQAVANAFVQSLSNDQLVRAHLISSPQLPSAAVQPRPPIIIGAAVVLGVIGGLLLVVAVERVRRRVESSDDVAELTDRPVVGLLPHARSLSRDTEPLTPNNGKLPEFDEAIRILSINIDFVMPSDGRALLVTSSTPGQGKSTVVANLAVALAQSGRPILVIDADIHNPRIHQIFGVDNSIGLTTLLSASPPADGSHPPHRVLPLATQFPNLRVIPAGPKLPGARDQLHVRFKSILQRMASADTFVLVDSGPVLGVSDARALASDVGRVLVVASGKSERPANMKAVLDTLALAEAPVVGIVLNNVAQVNGLPYYGAAYGG